VFVPKIHRREMVFGILATAQEAAMQRLVPAAVGEHGMDAQVGARAPRMASLWEPSPLIVALILRAESLDRGVNCESRVRRVLTCTPRDFPNGCSSKAPLMR
jgi:hypothetical protein